MAEDYRDFVARRADYHCEYCRCPLKYSPNPMVVEHIVPRSKGGTDDLSNFALACGGCNAHKFTATTGLDPATGTEVPLYDPRRHHWDDHFIWGIDGVWIIGVTAIGRATVSKLRLNREGTLKLRELTRQSGEKAPGDR